MPKSPARAWCDIDHARPLIDIIQYTQTRYCPWIFAVRGPTRRSRCDTACSGLLGVCSEGQIHKSYSLVRYETDHKSHLTGPPLICLNTTKNHLSVFGLTMLGRHHPEHLSNWGFHLRSSSNHFNHCHGHSEMTLRNTNTLRISTFSGTKFCTDRLLYAVPFIWGCSGN